MTLSRTLGGVVALAGAALLAGSAAARPPAAAAAALLQSPAPEAKPAKPRRDPSQCFLNRNYQGWRDIDDHSFYIRVNFNDFFKIETEGACPELTYPQAVLITKTRGTDYICDKLDWDLRVAQAGELNFATGCIVKSQRKLGPAEAAAIPPKQRP